MRVLPSSHEDRDHDSSLPGGRARIEFPEEKGMGDLISVVAALLFFIGVIGYVYFCERVK
jgi:hypothetical protein